MEWIDKNKSLPETDEFDDVSKYVLITDGKRVGIGVYEYFMKKWTYTIPGYIENDSNDITHWSELPNVPSMCGLCQDACEHMAMSGICNYNKHCPWKVQNKY